MMNKLSLALGAALLTVLAGCKDPNYVRKNGKVQSEARTVPVEETKTEEVIPVEDVPVEDIDVVSKTCTCPPGAKHTSPCPCGAADCQCIVELPQTQPQPEPEYTLYIVQRGDYLAKLSKRFNVKLDALRSANPQVKNDVLKLGQKIKIPGRHDIGEQTVPEGSFAQPQTKKSEGSYSGATKEYVVVSGDTLGKIPYGNGINIRQLKEMNGLKENTIYVGQKLKIPADGKAAAQSAPQQTVKTEPKKATPPAEVAQPEPPAPPADSPVVDLPVEPDEVPPSIDTATSETVVPPAGPEVSYEGINYVVQDGEDVLGLSIRFNLNPTEIRELNNLGEGDELKVGQVLRLPPGVQLN